MALSCREEEPAQDIRPATIGRVEFEEL